MLDMTIPEGALSTVGFQHATDECSGFTPLVLFVDEPPRIGRRIMFGPFAVRCARVVQKRSKVPLAEDHHSVG